MANKAGAARQRYTLGAIAAGSFQEDDMMGGDTDGARSLKANGRRCWGLTRRLRFCQLRGSWLLFCGFHRWQWLKILGTAVTVGASVLTVADLLSGRPDHRQEQAIRAERAVQDEDRRRLDRLQHFLSLGLLKEARDIVDRWPTGDTVERRLATALLESFYGPYFPDRGEGTGARPSRYWDSTRETGRMGLRRELRDLPYTDVGSDAQILLTYRTSSRTDASTYFVSVADSLRTPYAKLLAARETSGFNPAWSESMYHQVIDEADAADDGCVLGVQARLWLAKLHSDRQDWGESEVAVEDASGIFRNCGVAHRTTIHVRLLGQWVLVARNCGLPQLAAEKKSALLRLVSESDTSSDESSRAMLLNGRYWLAADAFSAGDYASARAHADLNRKQFASDDDWACRGYPWVCIMSRILWARCEVNNGVFSDEVVEELSRSADGFSLLLEGRGFPAEESLCHLVLGRAYLGSGKRDLAMKGLNAADSLRLRALERAPDYPYEQERARLIEELGRH